MGYLGKPVENDIQVNRYEYTVGTPTDIYDGSLDTFPVAYQGSVEVSLQGIELASSDFTMVDGTHIVLTSPATAGQIVQLKGFYNVLDNTAETQTFDPSGTELTATTTHNAIVEAASLGGAMITSARNTAISASASGVLALATTPTQSFGTRTYIGNGTSQVIIMGIGDGAEEVNNGTFDADTNWTKETGWTIANGKATRANTGTTTYLINDTTLVQGRRYEITFDVLDYASGAGGAILGGENFGTFSANGTYTYSGVCGVTDTVFKFYGSTTFVGSIDNVSVKEITNPIKSYDPNWVSGRAYLLANEQDAYCIHNYYIYRLLADVTSATTPDLDPTNWEVVADGESVPWFNSQVWIKHRGPTLARSHAMFDSLRGVGQLLATDTTSAEANATTALTSFNTDGFSVGSNANVNESTYLFVAWQEQFDTMVSGTTNQGKRYITASNAQSGKFMGIMVGSGTAGHEIPHGVGTKPDFLVVKNRDAIVNWVGYNSYSGATEYQNLNLNNASTVASIVWNDTEPTESHFTLATASSLNTLNENYVFYGSSNRDNHTVTKMYQGTGSAGNVVPLGLDMTQAGAKVMIKALSVTGSWVIFDNIRGDGVNGAKYLLADLSDAEGDALTLQCEFTTTGVILGTTAGSVNTVGEVYLIEATAPNYDKPTGGLDIPAGTVISYAEGTDGTTGDLDSIETTTLHSDLSMTAGAKNYIYLDKGNIASTSIYPMLKQLDSTLDANSPIYNVGEGEVYDTTGAKKSRVILGEVVADGEGLVIPDTLVEYPVAHQDVTSMEVHEDLVVHGEIANKQVCTAWVEFNATTTPVTIVDSYNIFDVVRIGTGIYEVYFDVPMDNNNYAIATGVFGNGVLAYTIGPNIKYLDKIRVETVAEAGGGAELEFNTLTLFGGKV